MKKILRVCIYIFFLQQSLSAQLLQTLLIESSGSSGWQSNSRTTYSYDPNSTNVSMQISQIWSNGAWHDNYEYVFTNDGDGNPFLTEIFSATQGATPTWSNNSRATSNFTVSNKMLDQLFETWDGSAWQNSTLQTFVYDNNLYLTSQTLQYWNTSTSAWNNNLRFLYSNNSTGSPTLTTNQTWVAPGVWSNSSRTTTTYTNNKVLTKMLETWTNNSWQKNTLYTYTYDNNFYLTSYIQQSWINSAWSNTNLFTYTNNTDGNPLQLVIQDWYTGPTGGWKDNARYTYTYYLFTGIEQHAGNETTHVWPVPSSSLVNVELKAASASGTHALYDGTGKMVMNLALVKGLNTVNIGQLPQGIYFLRLPGQEAVKIIKE